MNTEPLQPLKGRWPDDRVLTLRNPGLVDIIKTYTPLAGQNIYQNDTFVDESDSSVIADFAAKNDMSYSQTVSIQPIQYGDRLPAWLGRQIRTSQPIFAHEVTGKIYGYPTSFCVAYTPADDFGAPDVRTNDVPGHISVRLTRKSIIRVTLPKVFPQMVLDSNKNDRNYTSTIPASFKDRQKMTWEGDFANYFDFYAPIGLHVDTLTVLAPNFMQIVMGAATTFDVEFYGNELILVTRDPIYTPSVMATALRALEAQLKYMDRLLQSWNYQPIRPPFDMLQKTYFDGSIIKIGPLRLKPAALVLIILLGFVLFGVLIARTK